MAAKSKAPGKRRKDQSGNKLANERGLEGDALDGVVGGGGFPGQPERQRNNGTPNFQHPSAQQQHHFESPHPMPQAQHFHLVVMDVMLPDLDGSEVTRRIPADGLDVPVLFLTARSDVADRVAGLSVGGDDYVTKPFSLTGLTEFVGTQPLEKYRLIRKNEREVPR